IIPGGFSYGDWLRAGAIAARTSAADSLYEARDSGAPIMGICNGFQILVEAGLLPGALLPNVGGRFVCRWVKLYVERPRGPWLKVLGDGDRLDMPVAHGEGRYYIDNESYYATVVKSPVLRYADGWNPNGSIYNIAGVATEDGAILGLMPHPERAYTDLLAPRGFTPGGKILFKSLADSLRKGW
ncbi:MAG: phosphoribosylformylglycinamidine synthase I, partial [Sulfolobales archaeon]|nr:phosphoribosylformylglycinamidine synthase I [Sulfolobales archaeon]